ncbi:outer membrane protein, protease secretion system [Pseudomonas arsenicoxydans]|uniref:Outer membrane protein, protease secretion system n=1 Tax=Pseudomonas arsenicoxydans TaxID=702115 RepID=A0A1H0NVU1_9PSED|nr:TolC family outer membrane protein [Pseudomonas arsenicoxydans]SDO96774.1 outer membrane protein, protease secretion system [Pseudomonas arsenicoxydans]
MTVRFRYSARLLLSLFTGWGAMSSNSVWASQEALSLTAAYDASRVNDPTVQSAAHAYDASTHEEAIGRGGLYPQVSLTSRYGYGGRTDGGSDTSYVNSNDYQANNVTLAAQQPLYDKGRWAAYQEGKARGQLGSQLFDVAGQTLYDRVAKGYFDVARAENEIKLIAQQKTAINGLVTQSKKLYQGGQGAITDIDEAQARLDLVDAQEAEAQARRVAALRALSGRASVAIEDIQSMREELPTGNPIPPERDLPYWTAIAHDANPELAARLAAVKVAEAQADSQRAGHYPTLSLTTQLSRQETRQYQEQDPRQDSYYVGVQLDIPLYRGGAVRASVAKAEAQVAGAQSDYDVQRQQLAEDIETDYLGVVAGFAKSKAMLRAVESNQRALTSTEKGFQGGVRSTVDILDAQQRVFQARRDLLNTKLDMLQSYVSLHTHTGQMNRAVLEQVQNLF